MAKKRAAAPGGRKKTARGKTLNAAEAMSEAAETQRDKVANLTFQFPSTNDVINLAKKKVGAKKQAGEITGAFGKKVSEASDKNHLDKRAFAIATALDALDDQRLARTYAHLIKYMADLGVDKRATAQGSLSFDAHDDDAGEETPTAPETPPGSFRERQKERNAVTSENGAPKSQSTQAREVAEAAGLTH